jgi:hypothetical protein
VDPFTGLFSCFLPPSFLDSFLLVTKLISFCYLGASRYRATPTSSGGEGQHMDPFTGGSRYVASPASGSSGIDSRMRGTNTSQPAAASKPTPPVAKIIPAVCCDSVFLPHLLMNISYR